MITPYQIRGSSIDPPPPAPPIDLPATTGTDWKLSDQTGKLVLIFFGYTHCGDICPATLGVMKSIKETLGSRAEGIRFVYITVDPNRDTLDVLKTYLGHFDPGFIGLSGTAEQLDPVYMEYGVFISIPAHTSAESYEVDHSSITYLIDRQNHLRVTYAFGTPIEDLVSDLSYLLKEK
jgi:protein SCO1/2